MKTNNVITEMAFLVLKKINNSPISCKLTEQIIRQNSESSSQQTKKRFSEFESDQICYLTSNKKPKNFYML